MPSRPLLAACAAISLVAGACVTDKKTGTPTPSRSSTPVATSAATTATGGGAGSTNAISDGLMTAADIGEGWTQASRGPVKVTEDASFACAETHRLVISAVRAAEFSRADRALSLTNRVTDYGPGDAERGMADVRHVLATCPTFQQTGQNGQPLTYTFTRLPMQPIGDDSLTTKVTVDGGTSGTELLIVQVRRGDTIASVLLAVSLQASAPGDQELVQRLAPIADARLVQRAQ